MFCITPIMGSAVDSTAIVQGLQYFTYARERLPTDTDSPLINWAWRIDKIKNSATIWAAGVAQAMSYVYHYLAFRVDCTESTTNWGCALHCTYRRRTKRLHCWRQSSLQADFITYTHTYYTNSLHSSRCTSVLWITTMHWVSNTFSLQSRVDCIVRSIYDYVLLNMFAIPLYHMPHWTTWSSDFLTCADYNPVQTGGDLTYRLIHIHCINTSRWWPDH